MEIEDRTLRIGVVLIGHVMWLSAGALRVARAGRSVRVRRRSAWLLEQYPVLVWIPLVAATFFAAHQVDLPLGWRLGGVALALGGSLFAAWSMWSLGAAYGVRTDVYEGAALRTSGSYGIVRHPTYLGIVAYHVGASLALESVALLFVTALVVLPYTAARMAAEEAVLGSAFGSAWERYAGRVPALIPFPR